MTTLSATQPAPAAIAPLLAGAVLRRRREIIRLPALQPVSAPAPLTNRLAPWQEKKALAYIAANLAGRLNRETVSGVVNLSVSHFARAFKTSFGQSFAKYVQEKRLDLARDLMAETDDALSQIALACGFCDQAHLSRLFQRSSGTTPHAWRRRQRIAA